VVPPERIWVLTSPALRQTIVEQLPQVPARQILAEPAQRNTAPAIGLACHILQSIDPKSVLGVFPADHLIGKPRPFLQIVRAAYREAARGRIAIVGIQPRWAETGYGYIEFAPGEGSPREVKRFLEKPDLATAKRFCKTGRHAWNAGMFFWSTRQYLDALRQYLPRTASLLASLPGFQSRAFASRLAEVFPQCENISVDYAVMEKARGVVGFAAGDVGWNDVGSWNAVYELSSKDGEGNVLRGDTLVHQAHGNYVEAPRKLVTLAGVDNLIVVDTPDALLITHRDPAQKVGELVKLLEARKRGDLL
jgi:mannose-1-phosphate guanylyltransferase